MTGASRRMPGGVYQPRPRGAEMSDALAEARRALAKLVRVVILRGAGGLLFVGGLAALVALLTHNANDPSLNNATGREVSNWLGPLGATAADLLLQAFGFAALAALAPPMAWGARAMMGKSLKRPIWRAFAWPL